MVPVALCLLICLFDFNGSAPIATVHGLDEGATPPSEVAALLRALHCPHRLYAWPVARMCCVTRAMQNRCSEYMSVFSLLLHGSHRRCHRSSEDFNTIMYIVWQPSTA